MSRRRGTSDESDSLDLLLDTVSNVFGGVMFLTLLAALLILTRGAPSPEPDAPLAADTPAVVSTVLVEAETRRVAVALASQRRAQQRLDPGGDIESKVRRLDDTLQTLALAQRHARRSERSLDSQKQAQQDQQAAESDLEQQIEQLQNEVIRKQAVASELRSDAERTVEFRALRRSMTEEAVILLRYGRWYALQTSKSAKSLNHDDFFIVRDGETSRMTPKPHRGHKVTPQSLDEMTDYLTNVFPAREYHVVIAVWDDSFAEFNPLKDAIKSAGFQYRTLPCDSSSRLSNRYAADAYVQ